MGFDSDCYTKYPRHVIRLMLPPAVQLVTLLGTSVNSGKEQLKFLDRKHSDKLNSD
jgi:hypothetical protein